jgi:hypothetical protein
LAVFLFVPLSLQVLFSRAEVFSENLGVFSFVGYLNKIDLPDFKIRNFTLATIENALLDL